MLTRNRQEYELISRSIGKLGMVLGFHPDFWTLAGLSLSIVAALLIAFNRLGWALLVLSLSAFSDIMDGATARERGTASPFGGVLDHVVDRYAELFVAGGIMLSGLVAPIWVLFGVTGALMASYVRAKAESMTDIGSCNVGLAGRQEKSYILGAGILVEMMGIGSRALQWSLILVGIISHITAIQRLLYVKKMSARKDALLGDAQSPDR